MTWPLVPDPRGVLIPTLLYMGGSVYSDVTEVAVGWSSRLVQCEPCKHDYTRNETHEEKQYKKYMVETKFGG